MIVLSENFRALFYAPFYAAHAIGAYEAERVEVALRDSPDPARTAADLRGGRHKELWLIDHGACLYFHHNWQNITEQAIRTFVLVKDHVLLPQATQLHAVDEAFRIILTNDRIHSIVNLIPDERLAMDTFFATTDLHRQAYIQFLETRLANTNIFVKEAQHAATSLI